MTQEPLKQRPFIGQQQSKQEKEESPSASRDVVPLRAERSPGSVQGNSQKLEQICLSLIVVAWPAWVSISRRKYVNRKVSHIKGTPPVLFYGVSLTWALRTEWSKVSNWPLHSLIHVWNPLTACIGILILLYVCLLKLPQFLHVDLMWTLLFFSPSPTQFYPNRTLWPLLYPGRTSGLSLSSSSPFS